MATPKPALPLLSVVVPSYNQAPFLSEALDSIFRQNYPRLEVLVMDGGSTDNSVAVIQSYADRLKYWQSQPDGGQSSAINAGMARCSGDLVAWLNSDDFYWGDSLWTVARAYQAHPGRGLYLGNGFRYDQRSGRYLPFIDRHVAFNREALRQGPDYVLQPSSFFLRGLGAGRRSRPSAPVLHGLGRLPAHRPRSRRRSHQRVSRRQPRVRSDQDQQRRHQTGRRDPGHDQVAHRPGNHPRQPCLPHQHPGRTDRWLPARRGTHAPGPRRRRPGAALQPVLRRRPLGAESSDRRDRVYIAAATWGQGDKETGRQGDRETGRQGDKETEKREQEQEGSPCLPVSLSPCLETCLPDLARPKISLIVPCLSHNVYLEDTLQSFFGQQYSPLEVLVVGSPYGSKPPEAIEKYGALLTYWRGQAGRGLAGTVNEGLARASGEVLGWVTPGDLLTVGALHAVGQAFADDPDLDLVYANAAYVDGNSQACLADHGTFRSGFCQGTFGPPAQDNPEYPRAYAVPQPTVFFRRRLLDQLGPLDESYHAIADYELFLRYARAGKVKKIERTQALCRLLDVEDSGRWNAMLVELFRHSRRGLAALLEEGLLPTAALLRARLRPAQTVGAVAAVALAAGGSGRSGRRHSAGQPRALAGRRLAPCPAVPPAFRCRRRPS